MISRRSTRILAEVYEDQFTTTHTTYSLGNRHQRTHRTEVNRDALYDFLFEHDYPSWLCNHAKTLAHKRDILEWVMRFHTGESLAAATPGWSWEQRISLGQQQLRELAEDHLNIFQGPITRFASDAQKSANEDLVRSLELDGYVYRGNVLLAPESDVIDTKEEAGVLQALYARLGLAEKETAFHHLALSEQHYRDKKWDDCISNSRKFLECTLAAIATKHAAMKPGSSRVSDWTKPYVTRDYLEAERLLETKEKEALAKVYGLLSATGAHPYMAQHDQARLLRHLALTFSQFVMLRYEGSCK
jgi:hypothetical protein